MTRSSEPIALQVVGLAGSPRRGGNTETLLDRFLAGAVSAGANVEKVVVADLRIAGCISCDGCWQDGRCVVQDDFQQVHERLLCADVIAVAAPLFFWGLPAQLKALIDRGQCQWARKVVLKVPLAPTLAGHDVRRGVFICVGGTRHPDFSGAVRTVCGFFDVYGTEYWAELLRGEVDRRGDIGGKPAVLQEALDLGVRAASWR
jgi:hypothetical protein